MKNKKQYYSYLELFIDTPVGVGESQSQTTIVIKI